MTLPVCLVGVKIKVWGNVGGCVSGAVAALQWRKLRLGDAALSPLRCQTSVRARRPQAGPAPVPTGDRDQGRQGALPTEACGSQQGCPAVHLPCTLPRSTHGNSPSYSKRPLYFSCRGCGRKGEGGTWWWWLVMGAGTTWPSCGMLRGTAGAVCHPAPVARGCGRAGPRGPAAQQGRGWPGSVEGSRAGAEPAPLHIRSGAPLVAFVLVRVISGSRESLPHSVMLVFPGGQGAAVMPLRRGQQRQSPPCRTRLRRAGTDPPPRGVGYLMLLRCVHCPCGCCSVTCKKRRASEVARHDLCFPIGKRSKAPRRAGGDSPSPTSTTGR